MNMQVFGCAMAWVASECIHVNINVTGLFPCTQAVHDDKVPLLVTVVRGKGTSAVLMVIMAEYGTVDHNLGGVWAGQGQGRGITSHNVS